LILPNQAKAVAELLRELQSDEKLERLSV
jgi:hypothetical protein